jgi:hypothetical protein
MKYIKQYEYVNLDYYNVGDYVIGNWSYNKLSKIIGITNPKSEEDRYKKYKVKSLTNRKKSYSI